MPKSISAGSRASRLFELSRVLGVPVQFFYEDAPASGSQIRISTERVQRLGVRTERAASRQLTQTVRAVGTVQVDERPPHLRAHRANEWYLRSLDDRDGASVVSRRRGDLGADEAGADDDGAGTGFEPVPDGERVVEGSQRVDALQAVGTGEHPGVGAGLRLARRAAVIRVDFATSTEAGTVKPCIIEARTARYMA